MLLVKRTKVDWNLTGEYDKSIEKCHQKPYFEMSLGKMLGGSSSSNYLNYARGLPSDYDSWAEVAEDDTWKWSNVLEYFKKSERLEDPDLLQSPDSVYHGTEGNLKVTKDLHPDVQKFLEVFKELGNEIHKDLNEKHLLGYSELMLTIADGKRQSSAYAFLRPIKERTNLHLLKYTTVKKILFDKENNAIGVEAITEDGQDKTYLASKEVIISAGVFNTPKLLMLSGIGPKEHLQSLNIDTICDSPVGKNLQDHLAVSMLHKMKKVDGPFPPLNYRKNPAPQIIGYTSMDKSKKEIDYLSLSFLVNPEIILSFCAFGYRYKHEICDEFFTSGQGREIIFHQIVKHNPKSRGRVLLRSANYADPPLIYTDYMSDESDLDDIAKYTEHFSLIGDTSYFRSVDAEMIDPTGRECGHLKNGSPEYWKCYSTCMMTGLSHYTSSCPMGAVVDGKLRVKGVKRLRIADASVMPSTPGGPPASSVVMIGEKLSQFLKET